MNDGAGTEIDECAAGEVAVLQVDVDVSLTVQDNAQAIIVDGEGRSLVHQQTEHGVIAADHCQFAIHEYMLSELREVWCEDIAHSCDVHQLRLPVHNMFLLFAKIIIFSEIMF